ncbi:MAG: hypothetical protein HOP29_08340 [Phycisphaerales bacterium]|nr:hypothetical protein [Phycisphaerales bacterium]
MGVLETAIRREAAQLLDRVPAECLPAVLPVLAVLSDERATRTPGVAQRFAERWRIMRRFQALAAANPGRSASWVHRAMVRERAEWSGLKLRTLQWWIQEWNRVERHLAAGPASMVDRNVGRPRKAPPRGATGATAKGRAATRRNAK